MTLASELHAIADRLELLSPSHRDPHRYFEDKSELVGQLRRLADQNMGFRTLVAANDNTKRRTA